MKSTKNLRLKQLSTNDRKLPPDEFMAAAVGDTKWLHYSLKDGHDPSMFDKQGLTPIHIAALNGKLDCLKMLIENYHVDVNLPTYHGFTPLYLAINKNIGPSSMQCVRYLIRKGANVNCLSNENITVVHKAASEGLVDCLKALLKEGANPNVVDSRNNSALDLAKIWGKRECARILQNKVWDNAKDLTLQKKVKASRLNKKFRDLQQEVLHQILSEKDFFGNISYADWFELKGFQSDPSHISMYTNRKQVGNLMSGLVSRLFANGTIKDVASRMEKLLQAYVKASEMKSISSLQAGTSAQSRNVLKTCNIYSNSNETNVLSENHEKVHQALKNMQALGYNHGGDYKPKGIYSTQPASSLKHVELSPGVLKGYIPWNPSTNLLNYPVTDIQYPDTVSISIKPEIDDDDFPIFPMVADLSVQVDNLKDKIVLKLFGSKGKMEVVEVPVPFSAREFLEATVFGHLTSLNRKRKRKLKSQCVHIYDIQKKRHPKTQPLSEIVMHIKVAMDGYMFGCT